MKRLSERHKKKISASTKGRVFSLEHRKRLSISRKGKQFTRGYIRKDRRRLSKDDLFSLGLKIDKKFSFLLEKTWRLSSCGYLQTHIRKEDGSESTRVMHLFILPKKEGFVIDHINRDKLDNRKKNLRYASLSLNSINRDIRKDNKSGYKGVSWNKSRKSWHAQIKVEGRVVSIGYFYDKKNAAKEYNKMAYKFYGKDAVLNKI